MLYLVEVIRYGKISLGVSKFGIFDDFDKIAPAMENYNSYRGGKYPSYFVTKFEGLNPQGTDFPFRERYDLYSESKPKPDTGISPIITRLSKARQKEHERDGTYSEWENEE